MMFKREALLDTYMGDEKTYLSSINYMEKKIIKYLKYLKMKIDVTINNVRK